MREDGQIASLPEPSAIINTLCAHHVLERLAYPSATVRFEHQQFQEFYVALMLEHRLKALAVGGAEQEILEFTKEFVNEPAWTEPLRMVAEEIGAASAAARDDVSTVKAGTLLVSSRLRKNG